MNTSSMNSHENGKLHIRKIKWLKLGNLIWHVTDIAEQLGISKTTLYKYLRARNVQIGTPQQL